MNNETNQPIGSAGAPRRRHRVAGTLFGLLFAVVIAVAGALYGQDAIDQVYAWQYTPNERVASVNDEMNLTTSGERLFYASRPAIESGDQFNTDCESVERTAAILGCYYHNRIYLYDITREELKGALEVTAAHELLHAAYQRLNFFERSRVDAMIQEQYEQIKNNPDLKELMQYYETTEPGAGLNELHSIIGTTVASISPDLENYYGKYFKNRSSIVAMNQTYNQGIQKT